MFQSLPILSCSGDRMQGCEPCSYRPHLKAAQQSDVILYSIVYKGSPWGQIIFYWVSSSSSRSQASLLHGKKDKSETPFCLELFSELTNFRQLVLIQQIGLNIEMGAWLRWSHVFYLLSPWSVDDCAVVLLEIFHDPKVWLDSKGDVLDLVPWMLISFHPISSYPVAVSMSQFLCLTHSWTIRATE